MAELFESLLLAWPAMGLWSNRLPAVTHQQYKNSCLLCNGYIRRAFTTSDMLRSVRMATDTGVQEGCTSVKGSSYSQGCLPPGLLHIPGWGEEEGGGTSGDCRCAWKGGCLQQGAVLGYQPNRLRVTTTPRLPSPPSHALVRTRLWRQE